VKSCILEAYKQILQITFLHGNLEDILHVAATGVYHAREGAVGLQAKEES